MSIVNMSKKKPSKQGEICRAITPVIGHKDDEVYVVIDNDIVDETEFINVVPLKSLQRNLNSPDKATRLQLIRCELEVLANDLESYIKSWNV